MRFGLVFVVLPLMICAQTTSALSAEKPSFVIFLSDDHGWWDSTVYGALDVRTPNMQRLADEGMTLTHCFVASPACAPSRAALLTGLMPARNGAEANHTYCHEGIETLPAYLQELGYEVAAFGKVAHGRDVTRHGFDHHDRQYSEDVVARYLAERDAARPLCLFVGTHQPHVPWPENDGYDPAKLCVPPTHVDTPETRTYRARYYTDVTVADAELGQIYDLAREKLGRNTLFIYTSDHGAQWPLGKWNLYDAGIRTPFIAVWPDVIKPGQQCDAMASWVDLLPTLIELAGGTPPTDIDGRSFAGVLRGQTDRHRDHIFATHSGDGRMNVYPIRCVRTERFKYILNLRPDFRHTTHFDLARDKDGLAVWQSWERAAEKDDHARAAVLRYARRPREELYDVGADPHETKNLVDSPEHRATVDQLRGELEAWMEQQGDTKKVFSEPYLLADPKPEPIGVREARTRENAPVKPPPGGAPWRYVTVSPGAGWETAGFDDRGWKSGAGGFGRINQPAARVRTRWNTPDIWLRRTFEIERLPKKPALLIFHDEDAEVYLNGVEIARFTGYGQAYFLAPLNKAGLKALKPASNLLAVHCRQTRGGQYIDAAIIDATEAESLDVAVATFVGEGEAPIATPWSEAVTEENAWREYPRPQMVRPLWQNLNGHWDYAVTRPGDTAPSEYDGNILVPFCTESPLSGVGRRVKPEERVWYRRTFSLPDSWRGGRLLLHFGAVDWEAAVWVNGRRVGEHRGGYVPFTLDVTDALTDRGDQELTVRAWDPRDDQQYLRGKQSSKTDHYETSTGIWQTVWLEPVAPVSIAKLKLTPDVDRGVLTVEPVIRGDGDASMIEITALDGETEVARASGRITAPVELKLDQPKLWSPDRPFLYDLEARLVRDGQTLDTVESYFGMRKIEVGRDGGGINRILLNGQPIFQIGPLDQSYWPESVFTPPSERAMVYDLQYLKDVACNMVRLHITTNPDRWYYACDRLGLLVWQDFVCGTRPKKYDQVTDDEAAEWRREQRAMIDWLQNHPSIVMWVVFNESWNQHRTEDQTAWAMSYDPTRLVSVASGWDDVPGLSDVRDIHDYTTHPSIPRPVTEPKRAVVLGECGGFNCIVTDHNWHGETQPAATDNDDWVQDIKRPRYDMGEPLAEHYEALVEDLRLLQTEGLCGAVYTQLTDMKREQNGYLTFDRRVSKIEPARLRAIHERLFASRPRLLSLLSGADDQPVTWRYAKDTPRGEWTAIGYDDTSWQQGHGPFGVGKDSRSKLGTPIDSDRFYLRKPFVLHDVPASVAVRVRISGQFRGQLNLLTIHLNGRAIAIDNTRHIQAGDRVSLFHLHPEQLKLLSTGRNVLAVEINRHDVASLVVDVDLLQVED
jgi:arylsulfatase A-like enzyme